MKDIDLAEDATQAAPMKRKTAVIADRENGNTTTATTTARRFGSDSATDSVDHDATDSGDTNIFCYIFVLAVSLEAISLSGRF